MTHSFVATRRRRLSLDVSRTGSSRVTPSVLARCRARRRPGRGHARRVLLPMARSCSASSSAGLPVLRDAWVKNSSRLLRRAGCVQRALHRRHVGALAHRNPGETRALGGTGSMDYNRASRRLWTRRSDDVAGWGVAPRWVSGWFRRSSTRASTFIVGLRANVDKTEREGLYTTEHTRARLQLTCETARARFLSDRAELRLGTLPSMPDR